MLKDFLVGLGVLAVLAFGIFGVVFYTPSPVHPASTIAVREASSVYIRTAAGGHGTGVYLGSGYVLTAAHVAKEGVDAPLTVTDENGNTVTSVVLWFDEAADVGMLKVNQPLTGAVDESSLACGTPDPVVGDAIEIVGNPINLLKVHTWGRVAAGVTVRENQVNFIVDATIAPGNSGGPAYDSRGNIAGIVVAMPSFSPNGMSLVLIPLSYVIPRSVICKEIADHARKPNDSSADQS